MSLIPMDTSSTDHSSLLSTQHFGVARNAEVAAKLQEIFLGLPKILLPYKWTALALAMNFVL